MAGDNKRQWIKIDTIVNQYIDSAELSPNKFFRLFNIAFRGMEELGLDFFYEIKTVRLPINANYTVSLPADYINFTKIGVLSSNGEISQFVRNNGITKYSTGIFDLTQDLFYNYYDGTNLGYIHAGNARSFLGNFNVDNASGIISITGAGYPSGAIALEYVASPQENGDYYVPIQFRQALIAWIAWQDIVNLPSSRKGSLGDKRERERLFYNQRRLARERYKPFNLHDAYLSSMEQSRMIVGNGGGGFVEGSASLTLPASSGLPVEDVLQIFQQQFEPQFQ